MERDEAQAIEGVGGRTVSRRGLLTGAVLGAVALVLVACDGGEDGDDEGGEGGEGGDDDDDDSRRRRRRGRR